MNRVALVALALTGLTAGALGADTLGPRAGRLASLDPMLLLMLAAIALGLTALIVHATRRPVVRPVAPAGEFIRRRVQGLAADGAAPDRIARDTGLPRDVVLMALRAEDAAARPAATAASPDKAPRSARSARRA